MDLHFLHDHLDNLLLLHSMNINFDNGLRVEHGGMADDLHRELDLYWDFHSLFNWHYVFDIYHPVNKSIDVDFNRLLFDACDCLLDDDLLNFGILLNGSLNFNDFLHINFLNFLLHS